MEFVAEYEIKSELSVIDDGRWFRIADPRGRFRARLRNIVRSDFSSPFLLSLHLTFDADDLNEAKELADDRLRDCLNILALATGCSFVRHRIRRIIVATPGLEMRALLMWSDSIAHEDPEPLLGDPLAQSINTLLTFDMPPAMRRALSWYRLGVDACVPDDQFQYFWFALELLAAANRPTERVNDRCPRCRAALYCETCKTHPVHRPYEKQAIRALMESADRKAEAAMLDLLEETRNTLMHGGTLREIQEKLPEPHEDIVDVLGRIVFKALMGKFPPEIFRENLLLANPNTYIHRSVTGVAHMETIFPLDEDGELDLSTSGMKFEMVTDAHPQSAAPFGLAMTRDQFARLDALSRKPGAQKEMFARIMRRTETEGEEVRVIVLATDMALIREAVDSNVRGDWQDLFREILTGRDSTA